MRLPSVTMGGTANADKKDERAPGFADVLRTRVFAVLYGAETLSIVGDQLARVALSVLVYRQTGSAAATAITYAATFLPAIIGGAVLAGVGDRFPRRAVMVGCDLLRAALFAGMAVPAVPLAGLIAMLVVAVFLGPAFSASEVSYLATALGTDRFRVGNGLRMITSQAAQVGGFAVGGVLVAVLNPQGALAVNAATFVGSALVVGLALPGQPAAAASPSAAAPAATAGAAAPASTWSMWRDRRLRALVALSTLAGFFVVPEGLAVPFSGEVHATTVQAGLLLAAIPLGGALGAGLLVRAVPARYRRAIAHAMAVGCGLPLAATVLIPHWSAAMGLWLLSGVFAAYQVEVMTSVVQAVPDAHRARLVSVVGAALLSAQGIGLVVFGEVARLTNSAEAIALAGAIGSALALVLVLGPLRRRSQHRATHRRVRPATSRPAVPRLDISPLGAPAPSSAGTRKPTGTALFETTHESKAS